MGTNHVDKVVLSIGGSLIVPNGGISTDFLQKLNSFVRNQLASHPDRQFFLVIGGGSVARHYRDAGKGVIGKLTDNDLDWLGIHATRLNAHLVRTIFHDVAHPVIIDNYEVIRKVDEPVVVASGWKPGWSTDYCATLICEDYNVRTVLNLTNIPQVYDKDPRKFKDAKPFDKISWKDFRELVGEKWSPGMNSPFDPVAAKKAEQLGVKVVVMSGEDLENVENYLSGKKFIGTVIE